MEHTDPWFDALYTQYALTMFKTAKAILNNSAVAEELVHDVFVILLMKRDEVEHYEHPGAWLFRTLRNRISNEIQRVRYTREVSLDNVQEKYIAVEEANSSLEDVLPKGLSTEERQFLIWYYEENLSHEEIARLLGISVHACHGRLYRLKRKCFDLLTNEKQIKRA